MIGIYSRRRRHTTRCKKIFINAKDKIMEETIKAYTLLIELVKKLHWEVAMPTGGGPEDDGIVHGMIIGEKTYVNYVLKHLDS
jgi:hypothetical protein